MTLSANRVRNVASSSAESPPPTTAISCPRKKKPSQVAQVETPWPRRSRSDSDAEHARLRAGRDDDRVRGVLGAADPHPLGVGREVDAIDVGGDELGAEAHRLLAELRHELGSEDPGGKARVVLDVGGEHELPARADPFDDERVQVCPRGVDRRGQAGRARIR